MDNWSTITRLSNHWGFQALWRDRGVSTFTKCPIWVSPAVLGVLPMGSTLSCLPVDFNCVHKRMHFPNRPAFALTFLMPTASLIVNSSHRCRVQQFFIHASAHRPHRHLHHESLSCFRTGRHSNINSGEDCRSRKPSITALTSSTLSPRRPQGRKYHVVRRRLHRRSFQALGDKVQVHWAP